MEVALESIDNGSEHSASPSPEHSPSHNTATFEDEVLIFICGERRVDSPLRRHHPDQFAVFEFLAEVNPQAEEFILFCSALRAEIEGVCLAGRMQRDEEKSALTVGQALCRARRSSKLLSAWRCLVLSASSVSSDIADSCLQACLASCVTHLWGCWKEIDDGGSDSDNESSMEDFTWESLSEEQRDKIMYHGGWTLKRVRENVARASADDFGVRQSVSDPTVVNCSKEELMALSNLLGEDTVQDDGRFLFVLVPQRSVFFWSSTLFVRVCCRRKQFEIIAKTPLG